MIYFPQYTIKQDGYDSIPILRNGEWRFQQFRVWNGIEQTLYSEPQSFKKIIKLCNISEEDAIILKLRYGLR